MSILASLIIPTHNRSASLKKMLESLAVQAFRRQDFEVVIVADGCKDGTVEMLKEYKGNLNLVVCELKGVGAAAARNWGASLAKGECLIFVDDDMEPSVDFIKEHISSHRDNNSVVIGYSPLKLEVNASTQRMRLREWWEEKFQAMRNKYYRFKYDDLTSGNFSISSTLFKKMKGFDTTLLCNEDHEMGFRLIKSSASFHFAYAAKAYHYDRVTDLKRSMQRKKSEGISDILIKKLHADYNNDEAKYYLSHRTFSKTILLKAIQHTPPFCDSIAHLGLIIMNYFERLKIRMPWWTINNYLHQYWYLRGLMQSAKSVKELRQLIFEQQVTPIQDQKLFIDLEQGLKKAEEYIDQMKPSLLDIYYGTNFIGTVYYQAGYEPLKGKHLRKILKDQFSEKLTLAIYPEKIFKTSF
ncbi:MAG TPA: glycosyltransferase family 2 protein [Flavisolibacter sp.]|nr:glycosyltransferase family 2 protein [Flavisolibacter sp.]